LVNAIYHFPPATRDTLENEFNILEKFSDALCKGSMNTHPVLKTPFDIILLVREKSADPCSSPTEDRNDERYLNFVAWMSEMIIVHGPEGNGELDQLLSAEQMLRLLFVYDQAFFGQGISYPLVYFHSAGNLNIGLEYTHAIYCPSIFFFDAVASHPSKSSEEPFRKSVHGVHGNEFGFVVDNPITDRGDKPKEIFDSRKIERRKLFPKTLCSCGVRDIHSALLVGKQLACIMCAFLDKSYPSAQYSEQGRLRIGRTDTLTHFS